MKSKTVHDSQDKPFTKGYVMCSVALQGQRSVDSAIRYCVSRIAEFEGDSAKSVEVLSAISDLQKISSFFKDIQKAHPEDNIKAHNYAHYRTKIKQSKGKENVA